MSSTADSPGRVRSRGDVSSHGACVPREREERRQAALQSTLAKTGKIINKTASSSLQSTLRAAFEDWKRAATGWRSVGGKCTGC